MTDDVKDRILERAPESRLLEAATRAGMTTLRDECLQRVRDGETTLEEVVRITRERM
jgi:type II secretory ATPase GspE/PulE/Tfp pilus assembly ATPase PilB-like protein